jgi:hypothetical protein
MNTCGGKFLNFMENPFSKRTLEFDLDPNDREADLKHTISPTVDEWKIICQENDKYLMQNSASLLKMVSPFCCN